MVTWGANTVHTYGAPSPNAPTQSTPGSSGGLFGSAAPAASGGGLFGSSPSTGVGFFGGGGTTTAAPTTGGGLFGAPAPSTGGGLFGSAPSGSLFGFGSASAPAPTSGLFGAPAPASSLFGAPAPSSGLFGAPAPTSGLFGAPAPAPGTGYGFFGSSATALPQQQQQQFAQQQQQQQMQVPAQAALQAHINASARQEEARVTAAMEKLLSAYQGTAVGTEDRSAHFTSIVYNPATPEIRQLQWLQGIGLDGRPRPIAPLKPAQISDQDWLRSIVRNPDMQNYTPTALVGADALLARCMWQQEQAHRCLGQLRVLLDTHELVRERFDESGRLLREHQRTHALQRQRLLDVMRKVELARCLNQPLQRDEVHANERLYAVHRQVERLRDQANQLTELARAVPEPVLYSGTNVEGELSTNEQTELMAAMKGHRSELASLTERVQSDLHDLELIRGRVSRATDGSRGSYRHF